MTEHSFHIFADYHQFYLWDSGVAPKAPDDYTDDDIRRRVKVGPNVVVVQPVRAMTVPVELCVRVTAPELDDAGWDHVVECSLELPTGQLQVHECTGGAVLDLRVAPGTYRVRVHFSGLATLSDDGLDGNDRYQLILWPGSALPVRVLKQWDAEKGSSALA